MTVSCWDQLIPRLAELGHQVCAPDLALDDPAAGYEERIAPALRAAKLAEQPLVIVGHSQGTAYSTLVADASPGALLIHLCPRLGGFEPPPGAPGMFRPGIPFPDTDLDGKSAWDPDTAIAVMYADCRRRRPHPLPTTSNRWPGRAASTRSPRTRTIRPP